MFSLTANPQNRCVSRTLTLNNQLSTTYFLYDGWQLVEELDASGTEQALYVSGANVDELLYKATPTNTIFYQHDALGNTTALTDANGNLVEHYTYDVFGNPTILNSSNLTLSASAYNNRFLYTGREWLQEVGLYDYRNRVYSADLGRFLQTDPMRFSAGDVNVYRYVGNDPINEFDSNGLKAHIDVYRTSRISQTYVVVHENGNYIGSCNGNMSGFVRGKQGTSDGTYTVTPKKNYEPGDSFVEGTPTITGYERIHPEGYSSGCLTVPEEWANEIWDIMKRNQCHGGTTITFQTSQIPHAQAVNQNPRPGSIHHSWPIFNVQGVESVPQWPNGKGPGTSNYQGY